MIDTTFDNISAALNADSYDWLNRENAPLCAAIEGSVKQGVQPTDVYRYVLAHVGAGREALAKRCEQAAMHLVEGLQDA